MRDGYDYLGFQLSVDVGTSGNLSPKVRVGRKAIANIQQRLGEVLRHRPMQESISVRLECASAVIRGWSNYFKAAHDFSKVAHGLDHRAFSIEVKAISRKEDIRLPSVSANTVFRTPLAFTKTVPWPTSKIRRRRTTTRRRSHINPAVTSRTRKSDGNGFSSPRSSAA